ncbi:hypothetical protein C3L33_19991, partial [Rhododendron williamsianum]
MSEKRNFDSLISFNGVSASAMSLLMWSSVNAGTSNMPPLFKTVAVASSMASPGMDSRMLGGGLPFGSNVSPSASNHIISAELEPGETPGGSRVSSVLEDGRVCTGQSTHIRDPYLDTNYLGNSYMDLLRKLIWDLWCWFVISRESLGKSCHSKLSCWIKYAIPYLDEKLRSGH